MPPELLSLQYMAGLTDADGCIRLPRHSKRYAKWYARIHITQKNPVVLKQIKEQFGGLLYAQSHNGKRWHDWLLTGDAAVEFIRLIEPFLILKKEQAQKVIEAYEYPPSEREEFSQLVSELKR